MPKGIYLFGIVSIGLGLALALLFLLPAPARGALPGNFQASIVVDTLEDEDNSDGDCSLREAIHAANDNVPVDACPSGDGVITDTITFGLPGMIALTAQLDITPGGPLVIDGGETVTVSGESSVRVLYIFTDTAITLENLSITNGYGSGGGIYNFGSLRLNNSILSGNNSADIGGGIFNEGTAYITYSTLSGNTSYWGGAGITNSGILTIADSVVASNTTDEGSGGGIYSWGTMTVTNSTITENSASYGGGIYNSRSAVVSDSIVSSNSAYYYSGGYNFAIGGGIYNDGGLTVTNSVLTDNSAISYIGLGGGIYNDGTLNLISSTLSLNVARGEVGSGGGIDNGGTLTITYSTLVDNSAVGGEESGYGGGINNGGKLVLINTTLSGNSADAALVSGWGGGIINSGTLDLMNSTLSGNSADYGGGIYNSLGGTATLNSNIVAYSLSGDNCDGRVALTDAGYNLEDTDTCGFDPANGSLPNTDPLLGPLQDNGGPTWTHALLDGSPAIDAGDPINCPPTDQRGVPRPLDGNGDGDAVCDMGSFEFVPAGYQYPTTTSIASDDPDPSLSGEAFTVTFMVTSTFGIPGGTVTVTVESSVESCSAALSAGEGSCSLALGSPGSYTLTATYAGDASYLPSSDSEPHQVVNSAPLAGDDSYSTAEDIPLSVPTPGVLANDSDPDGDPLTAVLVSDPLTGALDLSNDGSFIYTPTLNYNGVVTFTYHASDGQLDSDIAVVTLTVSAVNDPPVAGEDAYTLLPGSTDNPLDVLANDSDPDGDPLSIFAVGIPDQGGAALNGGSLVLYTPAPGFSGVETFTYTVSDGQGGFDTGLVSVTVPAEQKRVFLPVIIR